MGTVGVPRGRGKVGKRHALWSLMATRLPEFSQTYKINSLNVNYILTLPNIPKRRMRISDNEQHRFTCFFPPVIPSTFIIWLQLSHWRAKDFFVITCMPVFKEWKQNEEILGKQNRVFANRLCMKDTLQEGGTQRRRIWVTDRNGAQRRWETNLHCVTFVRIKESKTELIPWAIMAQELRAVCQD